MLYVSMGPVALEAYRGSEEYEEGGEKEDGYLDVGVHLCEVKWKGKACGEIYSIRSGCSS